MANKGVDPTALADDVNPSPIVRKLRKDNSSLRKRVEELKLEMGENEAFFDPIFKGGSATLTYSFPSKAATPPQT